VRSEDVTTMRLVLNAISDKTFPFGIVINQATSVIMKGIENSNNLREIVSSFICVSGQIEASQFFFYPFLNDTHDKDNAVIKRNEKFVNFLFNMQTKEIRSANVKQIEIQEFANMQRLLDQQISGFRKVMEEEFEKRVKEQQEENDKQNRKREKDFEERLKNQREEYEKQAEKKSKENNSFDMSSLTKIIDLASGIYKMYQFIDKLTDD